MNKIGRILSTLVLLGCATMGSAYAAPVVFWQDDFETSGPSVGTGSRVAKNSSGVGHGADGTQCDPGDYFVRTSNPGEGVAGGALGYFAVFTNVQGSNYWRAEDLDGNPPPCDGSPHTLNWTGIDISGLTDLRFSGYFAAFDSLLDGYDPWEDTDGIKIEANIDSGGFVTILEFKGIAGNKDVLRRVSDGTALSHTLTQFGGVPIGAGGTLDLRVTVHSNGGNEEIAFDHFELTSEIVTFPEIDITSLGTSIADGDTTPDASDDTDFGAVALVGGSNSNTFTIHNTGSGPLALNGGPNFVTISGAHPGDFTVTSQPASPVTSGGGTTTFDIKFDPTASGLREATVSIGSDDSDENPYTFAIQGRSGPEIAIAGNGTPISDGDATPSTADHTDFGSVDTSAGVISRTFTIENTGADGLTLSGAPLVVVGGTDAADFTVTLDPSTPVSSGGSTTFTVEFDPSANGLRKASLSIANDDSDENPYTFGIQGIGQGVTFWTDDFESTAPTMGARVPADGQECGSAGDYFIRTNNAGEGTPSGTLGYQAVFANIQGGYYWRAEDTVPCPTSVLNWTGINIAGKSDLHLTGYFGAQTTSSGIWDTGDGLLLEADYGSGFSTLLEFRANAAGTGLEQVFPATSMPLDETLQTFSAPLGGIGSSLSLRLTVVTDGGQEEIAFDHFTLESDAPAEREIEVSGAGNEITDGDTTPDTLDDTDFGNVASGGDSTHTFTISNLGGTSLNLIGGTPITVSGAHAGDFTVTSAASTPVIGGGSTSFDIRFTPGDVGLRTATIEIASDDLDENPYSFAVQGRSEPEIEVTGNAKIISNGSSSASAEDHTFFGETLAASGTITRTFSIQNNGVNDLNLTAGPPRVSLTGADAAEFSVSVDATTPVTSGGGITTFDIEFSPSTVGTKMATVSIANDDPDDNPFEFAIEGIARGNVFWTDGFESAVDSAGDPRWAVNHGNLAEGSYCAPGDYFMRADNPGDDASLGYWYRFTNIEGSYYWRAEDLENGVCGAVPDAVVWGSIDITGKTNIHFNGHFAAGTDFAGVWEEFDGMKIEYSIDSGPIQTLLDFSRKGGVNATHLALDGSGREINEAFSAFHAPIAGTGNTLYLRVAVRSDGGAEEMGFDFFELEAEAPVMETYGNGNLIANGDVTPEQPDFTDFTVVPVGSSQSRVFEISNVGLGVSDLELTGVPLVTIGGSDPGDFTVTQQPALSTLPGGGMTTFEVKFAPLAAGEKFAIVSIDNNDPDDNPYEFMIRGMAIPPDVDLSVTKTDGVTSAIPGANLTYTIVASNAGPAMDPAATLADTFPAALNCSYTSVAAGGATGNTASGSGDLSETLSLPAGGSVTYTAICTIASAATGMLSNTATIAASSGANETDTSNDSATDDDTLLTPQVDVMVTKSDGVISAIPGLDLLSYNIKVSNAGPSDDPAVSLTDNFPSALSCSYTSSTLGGASGNTAAGSGDISETLDMPSGSSVTYLVDCNIASSATGTLSNTASVVTSVTDTDTLNNSATDDDTVMMPEADISVTKDDGVTLAVPGRDTLTYTIVASNSGPSVDPAVSLTDTFPAELACAYTSVGAGGATGNTVAGSGDLSETLSMPVSSSVTYTVSCGIDSSATGTLSNTATVIGSVTDPDAGNDSATDADTVMMPEADLGITKTDNVIAAVPGQDTVSYIIQAINHGPSDDPLVNVSDLFPPSLSCSYTSVSSAGASGNTAAGSGDLAEILAMEAGSDVTYTVDCTIHPATTGTLSNTATISGSVLDTVPANNSATDADTVLTPIADLAISIADNIDPVVTGNSLIYTVTVDNLGPSDALDVVVDSLLPAGTGFVASSGCAEDPNGVPTCTLGTLTAGSFAAFSIEVNVAPTTKGQISFDATVSTSTTDPDTNNDMATEDTVVNAVPPLFTIDFTPAAIEFTNVSVLSYTIDNSVSSIDATLLDFTDILPANVFVAAPSVIVNTCIGGTVTAPSGGSVITFSGGSVFALASCTISVHVTSAINGEYDNLSGDLTSDNGNSGTASATLTVTGDLDGDMIHDDLDNCPWDANADQLDFEGDGIGDVCDPDDDNDGMPDYWEIRHKLDPRNSWDRDGDPDEDEFINLQEYEFGTDPHVYNADANDDGVPDSAELRKKILISILNYIILLK